MEWRRFVTYLSNNPRNNNTLTCKAPDVLASEMLCFN